jgi:hypothetical protein
MCASHNLPIFSKMPSDRLVSASWGPVELLRLRSEFRERILKLAAECGVTSVKAFGSTARGDAKGLNTTNVALTPSNAFLH